MVKQKDRKIEKLEDFRRNELLYIINVYNKENIIKNYQNKNKTELIKLINKHILVSPDFKEIEPKPNKVVIVEHDKFKDKKIDKVVTGKDESKLYGERGKQRAKVLKLKEKIADMDIQIDGNYKLKKNSEFMKLYNETNDLLKIESKKLKSINDVIKQSEKLRVPKKEPKKK
jgi:hypothetical protein